MASKYWIKLYQEILQDPKMGMLSDNLWRRTIELFLLAGELSSDDEQERGVLPSTKEIAWLLRQPVTGLEQELTELAQVGILTRLETGWLVTNFAKRQAEVQPAERMKRYRERQRKQRFVEAEAIEELPKNSGGEGELIYTRNVTDDVTKRNTDIESESESESLLSYDNNGPQSASLPVEPIVEIPEIANPPPTERASLTPTQRNVLALFGAKRFKTVAMADTIVELTEKYGHQKVIEAMKWTAKKGMTLGDGIISAESALPGWGQPKQKASTNGHHQRDQRNQGKNQGDPADGITEVSRGLAAAFKSRARTSSG